MTKVAVETRSGSGTNEAHAALAKLGEERIIFRDVDGEALRMEDLRVVQLLAVLSAAHDALSVSFTMNQ